MIEALALVPLIYLNQRLIVPFQQDNPWNEALRVDLATMRFWHETMRRLLQRSPPPRSFEISIPTDHSRAS